MKIDKNYDFTSEDEIYRGWEDSGFFNPDKLPNSKKRKPFTISMPPPNATGVLHIGHAARMATQDIIIRFQRMRGRRTLWLPGTDHAAIATNSKVAGILHDKGIEVKDIPRQEFLDEIEKYVAKSRGTIQKQIRAMGASCDWSRERFTLDKDMNHAVIEAFERMYKDGIVYRGQRVVHWDPKLKTNISDDEVDHVEEKTKFYYFKYGPFTIGTARPETKFGDKYLVVHPKDKRYSKYKHGQTFELEWINGFITATVIKDEAAIIEVGSGAMTITPWHSSVDFEIAERHKLDREQIINFDGNLLPIAGEFSGMPIEKAREKIVAKLKKKGLLVKVDEDYVHNLATNSRGGGTIEPQIREQWFINVNKKTKALGGQTIKQRSLGVVKSGEIEVIPKRFEKIYYNWLEGLYDWNISRQIVYGHRIPAWYKDGQIKVGHVAPKGTGWKQDPDTLDTWFSTGLWTFSTLGWPKKTDDLKNYHPTDLLETGYDIIFFWVARMIIMTTYHTQQVPFKQVYLSGLVRDDQGRKMSKSLGNITDPLGIIKKYGVDPLRLALIIGVTPGNDVNMGDEKIGGYRNFVNKLWNISRYILTSVKKVERVKTQPKAVTLADKWILTELNKLIEKSTKDLETYKFSAVGEAVYEFTWDKLADWYVEISKLPGQKSKNTDQILLYVLEQVLKLWHPFTPFVTETIWKKLDSKSMLMIQDWPEVKKAESVSDVKNFKILQEVITAIRSLKKESKTPYTKDVQVSAVLRSNKYAQLLNEQAEIIKGLGRLDGVEVLTSGDGPARSAVSVIDGVEIFITQHGEINVKAQAKSLKAEIANVEKYTVSLKKKLGNKEFTKKAPKSVVEAEKEKLAAAEEKISKLNAQIKSLG